MRILWALATLFARPLLSLATTELSPSLSIIDTAAATPVSLAGPKSPHSRTRLVYNVYGFHIPSSAVNAAFGGAITKVQPFLGRPDDPITNDNFQYRAVGDSDVRIGVIAVLHHGISWRFLDHVLRQVSGFMNGDLGDRRPHMQELSFEIYKHGFSVGDGFVSYHPPRGLHRRDQALVSPSNASGTKLLLAAADPSLSISTPNAIKFQVPNTPIMLAFGFLGDPIPSNLIWDAFEGAHSQILGPLSQHPARPIPDERFDCRESGVSITVLARKGTPMTWKQLSWILGGLYEFITGTPERYQFLTCEISLASHGNVGSASVWYYPPTMKRALSNTSVPLRVVPEVNGATVVPVPDTPIVLTFNYLGVSIPRQELQEAIWAALDQIERSGRRHSTYPVPGNHFFQAQNGVQIAIIGNVPHVLSWMQLQTIIWGLLLFVTGAEGEVAHYRVSNFRIDDTRAGNLAYGTLRYGAPKTVKS